MTKTKDKWALIANNPKFAEFCKKKNRFLFTWWAVGSAMYLILLLGAGFTPDLIKIKIISNFNVGFAIVIFNIVGTIAIAFYYANKADTIFDKTSQGLLDEIQKGSLV